MRGTHADIIAAIKEFNLLAFVASPDGKRAFQVRSMHRESRLTVFRLRER